MDVKMSMPECRYCKSVTHSSKEWDECVLRHTPIKVDKSIKDIQELKVKDCNVYDLMAGLRYMCPSSLIISRAISKEIKSGQDVEIILSGRSLDVIKLSQFISYTIVEQLRQKNS